MTIQQNQRSLSLQELSQEFRRRLVDIMPDITKFRRELHQDPYISGNEEAAAVRLEKFFNMDMERVAETGRVGTIGRRGAPSIGIRAELDALPLVEKTGATWASTNGAMHACGHDVHQAALGAIVRVAQELSDCLPVNISPILQPREETYPSGALDIAESNILTSHNVQAIIGVHVHPAVPKGAVSAGSGVVNAAADEVDILLTGKGGHGGYPHQTPNPIHAMSEIIAGSSQLLARVISPMSPSVLSFGEVVSGSAPNVIPSKARARATLRTFDVNSQRKVHAALRNMVAAHAQAYGIDHEIHITQGEPVLENDALLSDGISRWGKKLGLEQATVMRSCGADDFSYYTSQVPAVMAFVGVYDEPHQELPGLHHEKFLPEDDIILDVAYTMLSGYLAGIERILV